MREPSRLELLRFLERIQLRDLARTRAWIATEEQRAAAEAARKPPALPPEPPEWGLERSPLHGHPPLMLHTGPCWRPRRPVEALTRDQAIRMLVEQNLPACELCRPDTALGVLE
jgi:hypothetical protein